MLSLRLSRALSGVTDASALQTDLEKVYQWAIDNNMVFNAKKFEALRYGTDDVLKAITSYTSPDGSILPDKDHHRDLGVTMSADGSFRQHITEMCQLKCANLLEICVVGSSEHSQN